MERDEDFSVYLASASPRRRELLEQIGVAYHTLAVAVDEAVTPGEAPAAYVERMALAKARAGRDQVEEDRRPVLGADTAIVVDEVVLGKPRDQEHGLAMLAQLSGRTHRVLSAVVLSGLDREAQRLNVTAVTMAPLEEAERMAYWASGEPWDKAGAYAVQGLAAAFILRLEGSYSAVMGLPLAETSQLLAGFGINVLSGARHE